MNSSPRTQLSGGEIVRKKEKMKPKLQISKKGVATSIEEADQMYLVKKKAAPLATQGQFVAYLMTHDGNPSQEFVIKLRTDPSEYDLYVKNLEGLLLDPGYADDFFGSTGTRLSVDPSHAKAWAHATAKSILNQIPTLQ